MMKDDQTGLRFQLSDHHFKLWRNVKLIFPWGGKIDWKISPSPGCIRVLYLSSICAGQVGHTESQNHKGR